MKFTIERDVLAAAVETLGPAVASSHPVCAMFLVDADEGGVVFQSTNFDAMIEVAAAAGGPIEAGRLLVPYGPFSKLLPKLKGGTITFRQVPEGVEIVSGRFTGVLGAADPSPWPAWKRLEAGNEVQITPEAAEMIGKVLRSTGNGEEDAWRAGIHFGDGKVEATDTERWSCVRPEGLEGCADVIVPVKFLTGVLRSASGTLTMRSNPGQVYFTDTTGRTWASKVIVTENGYPNTAPFETVPMTYSLTVGRGGLVEAIERLGTIADDAFDPLELRVTYRTDDHAAEVPICTLSLRSKAGLLSEELDVSATDLPDEWMQAFNPARFTGLVKAFATPDITIEFGDNELRAVRASEERHVQLTMPRKLTSKGLAARQAA